MSKKRYKELRSSIDYLMEDIVNCAQDEHKDHVRRVLKLIPVNCELLYDVDRKLKMEELNWVLDNVKILKDAYKLTDDMKKAYELIEILHKLKKLVSSPDQDERIVYVNGL